jgi:protein-S-isoprenylcysteine O-methyltransferase Ste14
MLVQVWPLVLLPLPIVTLNLWIIPFEETRLRKLFGDEYAAYCARVRRWI